MAVLQTSIWKNFFKNEHFKIFIEKGKKSIFCNNFDLNKYFENLKKYEICRKCSGIWLDKDFAKNLVTPPVLPVASSRARTRAPPPPGSGSGRRRRSSGEPPDQQEYIC